MMNLLRKRDTKAGFTLIELLVVIAIIGILASIVLASLNTARRKSRDARRIADLKQLQLAMELYFDGSGATYPLGTEGALSAALTPTYIPGIPNDPTGGLYQYKSLTISGATISDCTAGTCNYYHLGASLEEKGTGATGVGGNQALSGDRDLNTVADFPGLSAACVTSGVDDGCYDITP